MDDPWGRDTPPALTGDPPPLPPRLAELAELTEPRDLKPGERFTLPRAQELPEVHALMAAGWQPLEPAAAFGALPAVWPADHRCWLPDRLPRVSSSCTGGTHRIAPWDERDRRWIAEERAARIAECGISPEPVERIWLLRSPWRSLGLEVLLSLLASRAGEMLGNPGPVEITTVARDMLTWSEDRVWDSWHGPRAKAARQWRQRGRLGEAATSVVLRGLTPGHVAELADPAGAGLTEAQAIAWSAAVEALGEQAVRRIQGWRALGLAADPPSEMGQLIEVGPEEAAGWLAAGFTLPELSRLRGLPLDRVLQWRAARFEAAETERLLRADPTMTPAEARAFAETGIADDDRLRWAEAGFSAAEASAWSGLDILPQEARVWRSVSKGPDDAREHRLTGGGPLPSDVRVGWTALGSGQRQFRRYGVTDPPGTRGRIATEREPRIWRGRRAGESD